MVLATASSGGTAMGSYGHPGIAEREDIMARRGGPRGRQPDGQGGRPQQVDRVGGDRPRRLAGLDGTPPPRLHGAVEGRCEEGFIDASSLSGAPVPVRPRGPLAGGRGEGAPDRRRGHRVRGEGGVTRMLQDVGIGSGEPPPRAA